MAKGWRSPALPTNVYERSNPLGPLDLPSPNLHLRATLQSIHASFQACRSEHVQLLPGLPARSQHCRYYAVQPKQAFHAYSTRTVPLENLEISERTGIILLA